MKMLTRTVVQCVLTARNRIRVAGNNNNNETKQLKGKKGEKCTR